MTNNTCIFRVPAMMRWTVWAVQQRFFVPLAIDMASLDGTGALSVCCASRCRGRTFETELTADDFCIIDVPGVITDSAPLASN